MASSDTITPPSDDDTYSSGSGGGSWLSDHKYAVIGGGAVLLIGAYLFLKNRSSSSSSTAGGSLGTSTGPAVYEIAPGYLSPGGGGYSSGYPTSGGTYGSGIGTDQSIAGGTQTGQTGGSVSGTNPYTPTSTATLDNPPAAPAAPSSPSGFLRISGPSVGSQLTSGGYDAFANENGQMVQVTQGSTRLPTWSTIPAGSSLYWNPAYKG